MSNRTAPDGGTADMVGERADGPKIDDLIELAWQYRSDMRHPPERDSRRRRIEWINRIIGPDTGSDVL